MSVFENKGAPASCVHNLAVGCMGFPRFEYLHMECAYEKIAGCMDL